MGRDWDKLLAYETVKMVMIEDKILGGLHWTLTACIALYVCVYVFLWEKGYLKYEDVTGIVRLNIQSPGDFHLEGNLYCSNSGITRPDFNPKPCEVWSRYRLSAAEDLSKSFFLATHVEYVNMERNCSSYYDTELEYETCAANWTVQKVLNRYIADVEVFEIILNHNAFAPEHSKDEPINSFYYKGSSVVMEGSFVRADLSRIPLAPGEPDKFSLGTLVDAVSNGPVAALDSKCTDHTCAQNLTFREVGMVLLVNIDYSNDYGIISPNNLRYEISVSRMLDATHAISTLQNVVGGALQSRTVKTIRGVRLDFIQSGKIGKLHFGTIVSAAFASIVLLKVAAVMVDVVATKIMKNRKAYSTMKYYRVDHNQVELRKQKIRSKSPLTESFLGETDMLGSSM